MSRIGQTALAMFLAALAVAAFFAALLVSVPPVRADECALPLERVVMVLVRQGGYVHDTVDVGGDGVRQFVMISFHNVFFTATTEGGCIIDYSAILLRAMLPV